ncbi:Pr6Pr family membrane protein [Cellulomonas sp. S1-8]|uniref:Pr6Pr family membrane protein n=1 Tax=Cellulomonas sp. S1-8 TaxID=2904790 RepID=UPI002244AD26|nr:Pr6Pr family membrane protein [Cellulomonas sp. S1-8]UZN03895.1 Pr6Pr family membrane protein [Cellulomonas sp. S1-8]
MSTPHPPDASARPLGAAARPLGASARSLGASARSLDASARRIAVARVVTGALVVGVLAIAYAAERAGGRGSLLDYLGYFTNQTALLASVVLVVTGARTLAGRPAPAWWTLARGVATACLLVVGVVYNLVIPGTGSAATWISVVLHVVLPVVVALDWLLVADRPALPWRRLWLVLPYPLLWLAVVLVRGATDGWVPYGFLLPERGAVSLGAHVAGLLAALLAAGALVWAVSRTRGVWLRPQVLVPAAQEEPAAGPVSRSGSAGR